MWDIDFKNVTVSHLENNACIFFDTVIQVLTLFIQGSAKAEMEVTKTTKSVTIDVDGATTTTVESSTTSGDGAATGGAKAGMIFNFAVTTIKTLMTF